MSSCRATNAKNRPKTTIPEDVRTERGQSVLRARLSAELTRQLEAIAGKDRAEWPSWVRTKISEDFAGLRKRSKK